MDILSRCIIRKTSKWKAYDIPGSFIIIGLVFTIVPPILLIILIIKREPIVWSLASELNLWNGSQNTLFSKVLLIFAIICFWNAMFIANKMLREMLKIDKAKKLKKSWWWTIKKIQISSIEYFQSHKKGWLVWYYLEAKDGEKIYLSDGIEKIKVEWEYLNPDFDKIYKKYWYEYDENETHKQDVLKEIDKRKAEEEYDIQNWWLLKKLTIKWKSLFSKDEKKIVETWYQTPYLEVNWHKVSVWDTVDIYIDPNDEKNYRMDIDFLFDK